MKISVILFPVIETIPFRIGIFSTHQNEVTKENVCYGKIHALDGLDLVAEEGSVLGVLGPNGAGKTTAVRILTTLLLPDSGRAEVAGLDVVKHAQMVRKRIGLAGQYAAVDETLTGYENLKMVGQLYHLSGAEAKRRASALLERFDLVEAAGRLVKTYSG